MPAYVCIWEFAVNTPSLSEFEKAYGPDGDWALLFRRAKGYLDTALLSDGGHPGRYITADYWSSREDYDAFQSAFAAEYATLDARFAGYFADERLIGHFETVSPIGKA